jgi:Ca2+:H+ antiporter
MNRSQLVRNLGAVGVPIARVVTLALGWNAKPEIGVVILMAIVLAATVLAAVHHAEVIAHKVGEPFGSLVLAVAVTVIEVALIITLVVSGGPETASLARDTVFAAVMITTNGIIGICLLVGALRHGLISFNAEGAGALLATVTTLAVLCLVLPSFTSGPAVVPRTSESSIMMTRLPARFCESALNLSATPRSRISCVGSMNVRPM